MGGNPSLAKHSKTDNWNGSAWVKVNDLATARYDLGRAGTKNNCYVWGRQVELTCSNRRMGFFRLDPSTTPAVDYADAITGDFYYNSTTGQFKTVNDGGALDLGFWW